MEAVFKVLNEEQRLVKGPALVPDRFDRHNTYLSAAQVQEIAHSFVDHMGAKLMHDKTKDYSAKLKIVETWILDQELVWNSGDDTTHSLPVGTWMICMKIFDDDIWADVKSGKYKGFSVGGWATKVPLDPETVEKKGH